MFTASERHQEAYLNLLIGAFTGSPSLTTGRSPPSAPWLSLPLMPTSSGRGLGRPSSAVTSLQGMGIYKSTDAGKTWKCMDLEKTGRIGRTIIHPTDPNIVFAAAMGHCYGPQQERGVFRTTDGCKSWERVLFVDENTGCSDIAMDPNNLRFLFAGMWQMFIRTWGRWSGGLGSGLYM